MYPTTVGGSTSGSINKISATDRAHVFGPLENRHAGPVASITTHIVAPTETNIERANGDKICYLVTVLAADVNP